MSLTEDIKEYALDLGYSRVGVTTVDSFPSYIAELKSRYEMYSFYIEDPRQPLKCADPRSIMASAKSIVSVLYDFSKESYPENLVGKIGRFYLARCYNAPEHRLNGARPKLMRDFLKNNGCRLAEGICLPERLTAARAGIVTYGKNTFAYAEGIGSFFLLTSFVVDAELQYDEASIEEECPPKCSLCIEACPTQAIYDRLKMNPRRCIAFNTFRTQDGLPGGCTSYISPELREKMSTWIHGCDICQEVCPRNHNRLKATLPRNEYLERIAEDFELTKVLNLSDDFYTKRLQPLVYNYIKEKKYFQRNAAIAIGNMGDPAFIPALSQAMHDPEALVRGYTAWALGRISGGKARQVLETCLAREASESVRKEIQSALDIA
jgi:epoxyqueuosine reductase